MTDPAPPPARTHAAHDGGAAPITTHAAGSRSVRVTFWGGGYVILLTALLAAVLLAWGLWPAFTRISPPGDGRDPSTYKFDLSHSTIPIDEIQPVLLHRDMVPAMNEAVVLEGAPLAPAIVAHERKKLLVSADRVIGVTINGASRAYPISVLNVHEIINDTLGDVPIAVTYHWPSDGAQVFERTIGDRIVTFGVSGLLYNGNLLMYPKNEPVTGEDGERTTPVGGESLYSQLLARAVTGADAETGIELRIVPSQLTSWGRWIIDHPDTTVAGRDPTLLAKRYEKGDPAEYRISDDLNFAPPRLPPADSWAPKTEVVVVQLGDARRVYPLPYIHNRLDEEQTYEDELNGETIHFEYELSSLTAEVTATGDEVPTLFHAYWFAWYAMHPDDEVASD